MQKFYEQLIDLKKDNPALWNGVAGGSMKFVETSVPQQVLAFERVKNNSRVLVVFNLSAQPVEITLQPTLAGDYKEYFSGEIKALEKGSSIKLEKWGYKVFVRK